MEFAEDDVMTWPYPQRKLIVVVDDSVADAVQAAESDSAKDKRTLDADDVARAASSAAVSAGVAGIAAALGVAAAAVLAEAAVDLWDARKRADKADLPVLVVTSSQAERLSFSIGHPQPDIVYVGDPGVAGNYYPVASFHHFMFEGKVAEALRLLRSLGATEVSIEYRKGFDQVAGVNLSAPLPESAGGVVSGSGSRSSKAASGAKVIMELSPTAPAHIPQDLIWFQSEPLWRAVAEARLESGLRSFSIDVKYTDDFGVNASLEAKIAGVGLDVGGKVTKHQETIWTLSGTFADQSPQSELSV